MLGRFLLLTPFLLIGRPTRANVVDYEADLFPNEQGWTRETSLVFADRSIEDGWLVQRAEMVEFDPPLFDEPEDDYYRRSISEFSGIDALFLEWCVQTDGPREGFPSVSPAAIVLGGKSHAFYHFTIARDQLRFIDGDLNLFFFDVAGGVPHVYRLELNGLAAYRLIIEGQEVLSASPVGTYPNPESRVVFGARAAGEPINAWWDFVRYGLIPQDASGDYDSDESVSLFDFYFAQECLANERPGINGGPEENAGPGCRFADFDADTDLADFAEFQNMFGVNHP